jgi:peptidoglycan LD-endopeptidase CwlK
MTVRDRILFCVLLACVAGCQSGRQMVMSKKTEPRAARDHADTSTDTSFSQVKEWKPDGVARPTNSKSVPVVKTEPTANAITKSAPTPTASAVVSNATLVDSNLSLEDALKGCKCPETVRREEVLVDVQYYSFDHRLHFGQIVVNRALAEDVRDIFREIANTKFPIAKVMPICKYDWSDDDSVAADNTSGFNYRSVPATHHLSNHAFGRAIDLNPAENPYMDPVNGTDQKYDPSVPGTLTKDSAPTVIFRKHGWSWGGTWRRGRDYQHFEKL